MPRLSLTERERVFLKAWLQNPNMAISIHGYQIMRRLRLMHLADFKADMVLLERVFERLTK